MSPDELMRHVESLLFVAAEPAEVAHIAGALEADQQDVEAAVEELTLACQTRGIRVLRRGSRVQMASAPESSPFVEKFLGLTASTRLSQAALETLAIIAYRQPVTRAEIESLRGVDCDGVLRTLTARQLIAEVERLDTVGHPIRYGTTFEFMRHFALQGLEQLPALPSTEVPKDVPKPADGEDATRPGPEKSAEHSATIPTEPIADAGGESPAAESSG